MKSTWSDKAILSPGRNCWQQASAARAAVVVDTADYFAAFAQACRAAEQQILILGWDFDRHERLHRNDTRDPEADQIGAFLASLVKQNPLLNLYLLPWDFNMIYAAERELLPALRLRMRIPPRFHLRLDGRHPKGASHHQKIVVIDDQVAFLGGIDLTRWRWDTCEHAALDPRRRDPNGKPYPPFHDMMWVFEGEIAARLGDLARERWRRARGRTIDVPPSPRSSPWPRRVAVALHDHSVALSRTEPAYLQRPAVHEVRQLYQDSIAAAQRFIYIENQYFTAHCIARALANRLAEADGPEVILVLPEHSSGWLEQVTMDVLRARTIERLRKADRHQRLRIYYPYRAGLGEHCIAMHAKLMIVDDRLLRIGSANASARSMGLDTECDATIESLTPGDATHAFITDFRHRLLAEHLGCHNEQVAEAEAHKGLIGTIETLRNAERSLKPLAYQVPKQLDDLVPDSGIIDPPEPFSPDYFVAQYVPRRGRGQGRRRAQLFVLSLLVLLALAAAWRWQPLQQWLSPDHINQWLDSLHSPELRTLLSIGSIGLAALLMVPVALLALLAGIIFSGWQAFIYVLAGAMTAALLGFLGGRLLSRASLSRLTGAQSENLRKRLTRRGTVAVAVLRLVPVAPFAAFNFIAGNSRLGWRQFLVGSLLGLTPGIAAISFFSGSLWQAVTSPSWFTVGLTTCVAALLIVLAWLIKRWLRSA